MVTDVLIAGGGPAGASLALLLGRTGLRVELVERDTFPREKPCGEGLMPAGALALARWGVAVEGARLVGVRYVADDVVAEGRFPGGLVGFGMRRSRLDQALFEAAAGTAGVSARSGAAVERPIVERGRVVGLVVDGEARRAGLVVAADGLRSPLRRALGLEGRAPGRRRIGVRTHYRLATRQPVGEWIEVYLGRRHELYVTPLPSGELLVAALVEGERLDLGDAAGEAARAAGRPAFDGRRGGAEAALEAWIAAQPRLAERLHGAERISAPAGRAPLAARTRRGWVPGCVLVGDAAGYVDPITGGGMTQAILSAELLARFAPAALTGDPAALPAFDRARRRMLRDYEALTRVVLTLAQSPPLARATVGLMRARPRLFEHLLGVAGGTGRLLA